MITTKMDQTIRSKAGSRTIWVWVAIRRSHLSVPRASHASSSPVAAINLRPELKVVAVMPRQYPLLLGHPKQGGCGKPTQGKAANQLNALRVASGHVLQVLDANMDFVMLEGLKVPAVLSLFYSADDRSESNYHIVGFQEHVYTGELSSVGQVMANTEYAFGTIFQHTLANDLGVRLHYGHPDFVDTFWVLNNGGMSKASPDINLSEDAVSVQSVPNSCCQDL